MSRSLSVSLSGRHVGDLVLTAEGRTQWRPDPAWEAEGQHPRLGADFLRNPGRRQGVPGLPAWFENLLPERGSEMRRRLCARHQLRDGQSFALLEALGRDVAGAVEIRGKPARRPEGQDSERLQPEPTDDDALLRMSGLAGMQIKFSMSMIGERLAVPAQGHGGYWIAKLPGDFEDLPEVECATMTWAREAGFDVPRHLTLDVARLDGIPPGWAPTSGRAFAVRRFDRREDGSKIHQEDLCQALDLPPTHKYGERAPRVSFDGALRLVADLCGDEAAREMARRIGFMIASGNSDAHLKNWSLFWGDATRPTLTPCYDLVATVSWPERLGWGRSGGPALGLRLGGRDRFAGLDDVALAVFAKRSRQSWAVDEVMAGISRAKSAWPSVREAAPERMHEALGRHWAAVPLLQKVGAWA